MIALLLTMAAAFADGVSTHRIFTIQRSLNKNEVIYEARLNENGFVTDNPINVYWILHEKGGRTEPLTSLERRRAYGISIKKASAEQVDFVVKAIPKRVVTVVHETKQNNPHAYAKLSIGGQPAKLKEIFVQTRGKGLIPPVDFTEIRGTSLKTGQDIVEKIE